jgi:hypothetical protein
MSADQSESAPDPRWCIPEDVKASLRKRRLLPALWYVGPLEPKPASDEDRDG